MIEIFTKVDLSILLWIQDNLRSEYVTTFMYHITSMGSILLTLMALYFIIKGSRSEKVAGVAVLASSVLEIIIVNGVLKHLIARPRPFVTYDEVVPLANILSEHSFPSGHTALVFSMAFVIYKLFPEIYGKVALVIACLVGFSRVYLGVHYPSDVLAGIIVGWFVSLVTVYVKNQYKKS